jgi:hypothetical protein
MFAQHLDPALPRASSEVVGRKKAFWQERIVSYGFQPGLALRLRPVQQCLCDAFFSNRSGWSIVEDLQMPLIARIDTLEIPSAPDDLRVRFPGAGPPVQQDERFHVHLAAADNLPFLVQRIRSNPDAILQTSEASRAQVTSQPGTAGILGRGDIEQDEPPDSIPSARPALYGIPAAQRLQPAARGEAIDSFALPGCVALDKLLFFNSCQLPKEPISIGPTLRGSVILQFLAS